MNTEEIIVGNGLCGGYDSWSEQEREYREVQESKMTKKEVAEKFPVSSEIIDHDGDKAVIIGYNELQVVINQNDEFQVYWLSHEEINTYLYKWRPAPKEKKWVVWDTYLDRQAEGFFTYNSKEEARRHLKQSHIAGSLCSFKVAEVEI